MSGTPALVPVMRTADLRRVEAGARGEPLMERAGLAAAEVARAMAGDRGGGGITVLAGPGNNGGDAFVAARWLRQWFFDPVVVFRGAPEELPPDAAAAYRAYTGGGGKTIREAPVDVRGRLIVDGLFGIGLTRALSPEYAALVERTNATGVPILALDMPTGINADTGMAYGAAIRADATATFLALKPGLIMGDGVDCAGTVSVHALGVTLESTAPPRGHRLDWPVLSDALPDVLQRRVRNVHKGTFGTLGIVGGASGMIGAPLLVGRAALHTGAGKVWIGFATPEHPPVDWGQPELMLRPAARVLGAGADAIVCGPGLGTDAAAAELVARAIAEPAPLVVDADALTLIAQRPELAAAVATRASPTIATPHPAEAGRLLGRSVADVEADRIASALAIADKLRASVVLKGAGSVLAYPDGRWDVNATGNPALASAGTGDVLAGFAGAFLAQRIEPMMALRLAVCLHGAAADASVATRRGPVGLAASELPLVARDLLNSVR